jgi:glutamyl-tRNA synthetase
MARPTTRLAPSPTGALHLGNARTFVVNYLLAKQNDWRVVFRMEDLDTPRTKPGAAEQAIEQLRWLGLEWEEPILSQSDRTAAYEDALAELIRRELAYPCVCSRKDIEAASSAPAVEDLADGAYPGICREAALEPDTDDRPVAWRLIVEDETIAFEDRIAGPQAFNLARETGDFVIFRKAGLAAYQLAVVLDDAYQRVDRIVRGDDLLASAAQQIYIRRVLDIDPQVEYWHVPLVIGPDGRKLAKRHGDTRLAAYMDSGVPPQRVLGLIGYWCGLLANRRECDLEELLKRFDLERLPREPAVFREEDDAFLRP